MQKYTLLVMLSAIAILLIISIVSLLLPALRAGSLTITGKQEIVLPSTIAPLRMSAMAQWRGRPILIYWKDLNTVSLLDIQSQKELASINTRFTNETGTDYPARQQPSVWVSSDDSLYYSYFQRGTGWCIARYDGNKTSVVELLPGQILGLDTAQSGMFYDPIVTGIPPAPGGGKIPTITLPKTLELDAWITPSEPGISLVQGLDDSIEGAVEIRRNYETRDEGGYYSGLIWFCSSSNNPTYLLAADSHDWGLFRAVGRTKELPALLINLKEEPDSVVIKEVLLRDQQLSLGRVLSKKLGFDPTWIRTGTYVDKHGNSILVLLIGGTNSHNGSARAKMFNIDRNSFRLSSTRSIGRLPEGRVFDHQAYLFATQDDKAFLMLRGGEPSTTLKYRKIGFERGDSGWRSMPVMIPPCVEWRQSRAVMTGENIIYISILSHDRDMWDIAPRQTIAEFYTLKETDR